MLEDQINLVTKEDTTHIDPRKQKLKSFSLSLIGPDIWTQENPLRKVTQTISLVPPTFDKVLISLNGEVKYLADIYSFNVLIEFDGKDAKGNIADKEYFPLLSDIDLDVRESKNSVLYQFLKKQIKCSYGWRYEHRYDIYKKEGKSAFAQAGMVSENWWEYTAKAKYQSEVEEYIQHLLKFKHKNSSVTTKFDEEQNIMYYYITNMEDTFTYAVVEYDENRDIMMIKKDKVDTNVDYDAE